ncbi:DUF397 domain-containing protein [Actinomadura madurae]|uniref:DUF397 domain-containing protein n=1 Tax=Actinomadura madurae TaxID=1993 RepID=A0A1I4XTC0_9ACTN|nr:DUF397 domain-containing protein [Actinomadura madurae]SFN29115.1 protein of unknown function [Actinomadura madurae]SPT63629.1 Domain of uncharacterised function (DUF397) [Actinomadura madurae]
MTNRQFAFSPWRKSSHSGSEGQMCVEAAVFWRKSSHSSGSEGQCVEVAAMTDRGVALRDSKDVDGPMLSIAPSAWASLLADVKAGAFDSAS